MDQDEFHRLRTLFDEIVDLPLSERAAAIERMDGMSADMHRRLRALLGLYDHMGPTTARPALGGLRALPAADAAGQRIGAFVLERELGRGGMGNVFLAHRADGSVEQKVAVKLIRPEQLDAHTLARFRLERQVLALLKHPNIAVLLDLGETAEGLPYAVMEYVEGQPITAFCAERKLDRASRLRLFLDVCDAVAYAHRNMVVHRDIKPSNILVTPEGRPKLLDFGIAKPLLQRYGSHDVNDTGTAQRFFSPQNAAPEQVRGVPASVACDVYGLGVLLYELLAGVPPFDFTGKTPGEIEHAILELDPPPSSMRANDKGLRGDLDAIVARALRKAPEQRYATVEQFAEDVRRYLQRRPVAARKGRAWYRVRKFVSRNRVAISVAGFIGAVLAVSLAIFVLQYRSTLRERERAEGVTSVLLEALQSIDPARSKGKELTAREVFEQASQRILTRSAVDESARAQILATIAQVYLRLEQPQDAVRMLDSIRVRDRDLPPDVLEQIERTTARAYLAASDNDRASKLIDAHLRSGSLKREPYWELLEEKLLVARGEYDRAAQLLQDLVLPEHTADAGIRIAAMEDRANLLFGLNQASVAYEQQMAALAEQRKRLAPDDPELLATINRSVGVALDYQKLDQADALLQEELPIARKLYGEQSVIFSDVLEHSAAIDEAKGDHAAAKAARLREVDIDLRVLGENHPRVAGAYFNLGVSLEELDEIDDATRNFAKAVDIAEHVLPENSMRLLLFRTLLAYCHTRAHRFSESDRVAKKALAVVAAKPEMEEDDVVPLMRLIVAVNAFGEAPTPANRSLIEQPLAVARKAAEDPSSKRAIEVIARVPDSIKPSR